jgi:hypothetical protein
LSVTAGSSRSQLCTAKEWSCWKPGQAYSESEVNERLSAIHPDYAALRRYLVDDEFLHRRDGFYWRAGGTFEVDPF